MPRDPDADELLSGHPDEVAATTQRLRTVLLDAHPQLAERVRRGWHSINYRDPAVVVPFLDHAVELGAGLRAR